MMTTATDLMNWEVSYKAGLNYYAKAYNKKTFDFNDYLNDTEMDQDDQFYEAFTDATNSILGGDLSVDDAKKALETQFTYFPATYLFTVYEYNQAKYAQATKDKLNAIKEEIDNMKSKYPDYADLQVLENAYDDMKWLYDHLDVEPQPFAEYFVNGKDDLKEVLDRVISIGSATGAFS